MVRVRPRRYRGAVLIVVLGVLAVLALLGTTFATLQQVERNVSRNYLDTVRAKLIAMSGIQDAVERLVYQQRAADPFTPAAAMQNRLSRFYGDDLDELGTRPDLLRAPLRFAGNPSFAVEKDADPLDPSNPQPKPIAIEGPLGPRRIGFSGAMASGTYGRNADIYSLKVTDLQGLIHVNDGLEHGPNGSVSQNLRRILNSLGNVVGVRELGDLLVDNRPAGGYRTRTDLQRAVGFDDSKFQKFHPFVTVRAWQDEKVCNPVPLSADVLGEYPVTYYRGSGDLFRYGRGKDAWGVRVPNPLTFAPFDPWSSPNIAIFGADELNPQWIEIVKRAPVNVNSAPREVLVALLDGLKGFFSVERRRNEPPAHDSVYNWYHLTYGYRPTGPGGRGGELAYLYSTVPIQGPATGTGAVNSWAFMIADEIIACRESKKSPKVSGLDYGREPWGGPFTTWRQFSLFCDRLSDPASGGFLVDDRDLYKDYHPTTKAAVPSEIQKRYASRAIGDVLKANFNPNLHLNETNPEAQLWQRVDKTDLIVHSTEFCFTPMGYFEIESRGRVLRPKSGEDAFAAAENQIIAEQVVVATVKLFDVYRETHQADFYRGTLSRRFGKPSTNDNQSLEIGPEPDSGRGPSENEWSGYLALPTIGGNEQTPGPIKPAETLGKTPFGGPEWGSSMHSHFTFDGRLHHHASGQDFVKELASERIAGEHVENANDPVPAGLEPGPYTPLSNGGNRHRLARSFRIPVPAPGMTATPPVLDPMAPLDLRLDGVYTERHCALGYWLDAQTMGESIGRSQGIVSFWVKPGFLPEMSGKPRAFLSADRRHEGPAGYFQPSPFCLWYLASHDAAPYAAPPSESGVPYYKTGFPWGPQPMRTCSMTFGYGYSSYTRYGPDCIAEGGVATPTLNHLGHPDEAVRPSPMRGHRWAHVIATWNTARREDCRIFINGTAYPGLKDVFYPTYRPNSPVPWFKHGTGEQNCLRLGVPSKYYKSDVEGYQRNWPADATIDEFYWWNSKDRIDEAVTLARLGRFYKPIHNTYEEGSFTSQEIRTNLITRVLPPASPHQPTGAGPAPTATAPAPTAPPRRIRLIGAQWTYYGEEADLSGARLSEKIHDYGPTETDFPVECQLSILQGKDTHGPFKQAAWSRLAAADGTPIVLSGPFRYRVQFRIPGLGLDTSLLATPIFDDVTIFYQEEQTVFTSYWIE